MWDTEGLEGMLASSARKLDSLDTSFHNHTIDQFSSKSLVSIATSSHSFRLSLPDNVDYSIKTLCRNYTTACSSENQIKKVVAQTLALAVGNASTPLAQCWSSQILVKPGKADNHSVSLPLSSRPCLVSSSSQPTF